MDLKALTRFLDSRNDFRLTKLSSKRDNSRVGVRQFEEGHFSLVDIPASDKGPEGKAVMIHAGRGFRFLRTSPIVSIIDQTKNSTTFETEGGVYLLEKI